MISWLRLQVEANPTLSKLWDRGRTTRKSKILPKKRTMKMVASASPSAPASVSVSQLRSSFLCCPVKPSSALSQTRKSLKFRRPPSSYPCVRAVELDQSTIVAISVGVVSIAVGIGIPVFYESQIDNAAKRENTQPCFPCNGSGAQKCRFCMGSGSLSVELGGGEKEVSGCINCNGVGSLTCSTCQGTGIQPRYLDRREFKDDD